MKEEEEDDDDFPLPLFETRRVKGRIIYRVFATSVFTGILLVWFYRASNIPDEEAAAGIRRWAWFGMFASELWFGFYWLLSQSHRWNGIFRHTFKDRFSKRYMKKLPRVDIFVCTADPDIEPPMMVINTVLSVMAYDYPPEKLNVYLSDDGGSERTFHALLLASHFSKHWLPFCKKFNIEPRSPSAYFASNPQLSNDNTPELSRIKKLYGDMENEVEAVKEVGKVGNKLEHKPEFAKWRSTSFSSPKNHDTILQILIDGNDPEARDILGNTVPTLVYLAREKRPQHFHNFKAGAMNALLRVSSKISNAPIILTVDCDMYSNNSQSIQDALCFFMDEEQSHEFSYVQFPQSFHNMTPNDLYASSFRVHYQAAFPSMDAYGGPMYIGTGCFHRREVLCGRKYNKEDRIVLGLGGGEIVVFKKRDGHEMEELINLASCKYEENTEWGYKVGLKYGCLVEDAITGLTIQNEGWKSVFYSPERKGFLGVAGTTMDEVLVQQKRWSEGQLQILLSKYSPLLGIGKIQLGLIMGYSVYNLWSLNCFATLYYSIIPSLYLLKGISLFPHVSSPWFVPFAYVIVAANLYHFGEFLWSGGTILGWWNEQRMWLYKKTTSYLFAIVDTMLKSTLGYVNSTFAVSSKVSDEDVAQRYKEEIMEFGTTSPMAYILSSLAMLNLFCLIGVVLQVIYIGSNSGFRPLFGDLFLQILLCGILVSINLPLYGALFFRKDRGKIPRSVVVKSFVFSLSVCTCFFGYNKIVLSST